MIFFFYIENGILCVLIRIASVNYPFLVHIFMVPKVFEPLKFYCINLFVALLIIVHNYIWQLAKKATESYLMNSEAALGMLFVCH